MMIPSIRNYTPAEILLTNKKVDDFNLQKEEICAVKFIKINKLKEGLKNPATYKNYVPEKDHYLKILDEIKSTQKNSGSL